MSTGYFSQATLFPSETLRSYSSTEPGYLQPQIATDIMKDPLPIIAATFPVESHKKSRLEAMTATIAYFIRVGNTLFSAQFVKNGPNLG